MTSEKIKEIFPEASSIPEKFKFSTPLHQSDYLFDGKMVKWDGKRQEVFSPIYLKSDKGLEQVLLGSYPLVGENESMQALDSAVKAFDNGKGEWPTMTVEERINCMETFTRKMIEKKDQVVNLLMWEIGKSYKDSIKEFDRTVEYINDTIDAYKDLDRDNSRFLIDAGIVAQVRRAPLGVVLCMGPFNYPLNETYTTLIPALLTGNTVLFKPPKHGTLLHYPLLEAFATSFPKGVINTIYGRGETVVPPLMTSGKINVLTLIGSSRVADKLKKLHPKVNRLRAILGLDAKNAAIVLDNADITLAAKECILGSLSFNGQRCTALKILFVHKSIVDTFISKFNEELAALKIGMPWDDNVNLTPLPEPNKPKYLKECIDDAISKGAKVVNPNGGENNLSFVYPAVLYPVTKDMKLYREEQFGPVIPIVPFESIEEPINYLIESDHGQQVSLFGSNPDQLADLIDPLVNQVCRVNINCQCQRGPDSFPFTGRKDSAEGTLSVTDAIRSFTIRTMVAAKESPDSTRILNQIVNEHKSKFLSTKFIF
ncbi:MAG: NADP-dependent glyceraldehyde-3-phosphate dehydrogenase [Opitutaceae bacterium]|nr:NADP-dependent glyceraldehyde-3-phosphate dehydrogenase [Cytophagales bacterium]